jgi:ethanolamine utilization protein EutQ (cupin superfamily)
MSTQHSERALMEVHPGVFVSAGTTDVWESDPEVGGEMHVLCDGVGVEAGLSRFSDAIEPVRWTIPERETLIVLEGRARIEIADGPTLELGPGDMASLPEGAETTWHLTTPFKEFWVIQR